MKASLSRPQNPWLLALAMAVPLLILVLLLDRLPRPTGVFEMVTEVGPEFVELLPGDPIYVEFELPSGENLEGFALNIRSIGEFSPVDAHLYRGEELVGGGRITKFSDHIFPVREDVTFQDGDALTLMVEHAILNPPRSPGLPPERFPDGTVSEHPFIPLLGVGYGEDDIEMLVDLDDDEPDLAEVEFQDEEDIIFQFVAAEDDLNRIYLDVDFPDDHTRIRVYLSNLTSGEKLTSEVYRPGNNKPEQKFDPANAAGDRIEVRIVRAMSDHAEWKTGIFEPLGEFHVTQSGEELEELPLILPLYDYPWQQLTFWSWVLVAICFLVTLRWQEWLWVFFPLLAVVGTATGYQLWLHLCTIYEPWRDPDGYGMYGDLLYTWLTEPGSRAEISEFLDGFAHTQTATIPVLLCLLHLTGLALPASYVLLAGFSTAAIALCIYWMLNRQLQVSHVVSLCGALVFVTDLAVLRAWSRPSTDMPGVLLLVLTWPILIQRVKVARPWQLIVMVPLLLAIALSRPPGPAYLVWIGSMILIVDMIREEKIAIWKRVRTGLLFTVPTVAILVVLYLGLDWKDNLESNVALASNWYSTVTWEHYKLCLVMIANAMPFFWFFIRERDVKGQTMVWICASWIVFYIAMMLIVKGAVIHRLFLPILPAIVILACLGWEQLARWRKWLSAAALLFVAVFLVVNFRLMLFQVASDHYIYNMLLPN